MPQGSDKQCRLTQQGIQKLEDALEDYFGEIPSDSKVALELLGSENRRERVGKIRQAPRVADPSSKLVNRSSIDDLFEKLEMELEDSDYEKFPITLDKQRISAYSPNPFWRTLPIDSPEEFLGRQVWFAGLLQELNKGCSLNLVGAERMGRSSILKQVCSVGGVRIQRSVSRFAYLNLRQLDDSQDFFGALCHELEVDPPQTGFALQRALKGKQNVVCLDDVEQFKDTRFDRSERRQLRGLIDQGLLIVVVASQRCLSEVFADSSSEDSPLYGICRRMDIPPFSEQDVQGWVNWHLGATGISFTPQQVKGLWKNSEGVPGRLQQLAWEEYDRMLRGKR